MTETFLSAPQRPGRRPPTVNVKFAAIFVLLLAALCVLSSIPSLSSGLPKSADQIARKAGHILYFFLLTLSLYKALPALDHSLPLKLAVCALLPLGAAVCDEIHQMSVAGRAGNLIGFLFDAVGVEAGLAAGVWMKGDR